jgi:ferric-dicitrate binding protein FerR (iron transport regulator)
VSSPGPRSPTLANVEAVVRENVSGYVDSDQHEHGKQRLLAALRLGRPRARAPWRRRAALVAALAAAVAVAVGAGTYAWKQDRSARLGYEVTGGFLSESGYLRSNGPGGARLSFSDGTRVDLQDGARARIAAVDAHGARLSIENGHVALSVVPNPGATWYLDAGPFVIQVTGTRFDLDWSSYDDTLSVDLHEGNLVVSGPPAPNGVLLRSGQRLTALEGRLSIEALEAVQPLPAPQLEPLLPELDGLLIDPPPRDSVRLEPTAQHVALPKTPTGKR